MARSLPLPKGVRAASVTCGSGSTAGALQVEVVAGSVTSGLPSAVRLMRGSVAPAGTVGTAVRPTDPGDC